MGIDEILGNEMPCMWGEIRKEETYNKYADTARKLEIDAIRQHGAFAMIHFSEIPDGVFNRMGDLCTPWKIS